MAQDPDRYEPLPSLPGVPAYLLRKVPPAYRRAVLAALAALVALAAVLTVVVVSDASRARDRRATAEERARAEATAARRAKANREARPRTATGPAAARLERNAALKARRTLLAGLEAAILADARERARRGEMRGRYRTVSCDRFPKTLAKTPPQDDLSLRSTRLECIAATNVVARSNRTTGSLIGQPFRARIDFTRGRFTWCKVIQRPGELSFQAEPVVDVPRACGG